MKIKGHCQIQSAKRPIQLPLSLSLVLIFLLVASTSVMGYFRNVRFADENPFVSVPAAQNKEKRSDEIKLLAEGFHSSITNPFVAVVRDAETYSALTKLEGNLPKLDTEFFKSNIVIAAFLGERNTGGYAVEIASEVNGQIHVTEKKPGKGMMVPQMITSPFKIVAREGSPSSTVPLSLDYAWRQGAPSYRIINGTFTYSGGFAGAGETFELKGRLLVMREGSLVTLAFDLFSSGLAQMRSLTDSATAVVTNDSRFMIGRMGAGSLVPPPNGGLQASGMFSDEGKKLMLEFSPRAINIADSYGGRGSIDAELAEPATKP
ncbi:MAG TPA: protease complex subunit PrcB family protein [Pyrinomonadaceae bacterium]|nr:protease complex subunit PrcB family protein [Pyrinomonadaceae bacterium]